MSKPEQEVLPNFPEAIARAEQSVIDTECRQMHLARQFIKYGKWEKFSKDPEFQKKCEEARMIIATQLMGKTR